MERVRRRAQHPSHTTIRILMLITSLGQAQACRRHLCPRHLHVPDMRLGNNMRLGAIVGAEEGVMIIGHLTIVTGDAVAVMVMVVAVVVAVDGVLALHAGNQGTHIEQNMALTDPERYHLPRRCSHRQLTPSIRAAAVRRTIRHIPPNNLALDNRIRRCRSRSCRRKYNHISIHDSQDSLD